MSAPWGGRHDPTAASLAPAAASALPATPQPMTVGWGARSEPQNA